MKWVHAGSEIATQMSIPAAGVTTAADLLEDRLHP
jgi:hypothetical protein